MRYLIIGLTLALAAGGCAAGNRQDSGPPSPAGPSVPPRAEMKAALPTDDLPAFQATQQQGDVKVTLLKIARVTSYTSQFLDKNLSGGPRAIPGVEVTYVVEYTGAMPAGQFATGGVQCFVGGAPARHVAGVIAGGSSSVAPWRGTDEETGFRGPAQQGDRTVLRHEYLRGVELDGPHADLRIEVGFGTLQTFNFNGVPVRAASR